MRGDRPHRRHVVPSSSFTRREMGELFRVVKYSFPSQLATRMESTRCMRSKIVMYFPVTYNRNHTFQPHKRTQSDRNTQGLHIPMGSWREEAKWSGCV